MRAAALVLPLLLVSALLSLAAPAHAEKAIVVLDRGSAAAAEAERWTEQAVRLVTVLREAGRDTSFLVYGTRPSGRLRAAELRGAPSEALSNLAGKEGWNFEAGTDPRRALEVAIRRYREDDAVLVVLVGPFTEDPDDDAAEKALAAWNARSPTGSRIFAVGLDDARRSQAAQAEGWVGHGTIVLGAGEVVVNERPFSPLSPDPLTADVRVPLELAHVGDGAPTSVLDIASANPGDQIVPADVQAGSSTAQAELTRAPDGSRVGTVVFSVPDDPHVLWLVEAPRPRAFAWRTLAPDARLESPGEVQLLNVESHATEVGTPWKRRYRLLRTRCGPAPVWRARAREGALPKELSVEIGDEVVRDEDLATSDVVITITARAGQPVETSGTLLLEAEGYAPQAIPYTFRVPPGRVRARLQAGGVPLPVPVSESDAPWTLLVEARNANLPPLVELRLEVEPAEVLGSIAVRLEASGGLDVTWDPREPLAVRPGTRYQLVPTLTPGTRGVDASLTLELPSQTGVEGTAEGRGRIRARHPRIVVVDSPHGYRVAKGEVVADPAPLMVRVDPDGGTGAWVVPLLGATPTVTGGAGDPVTWTLHAAEPGLWHLLPASAWTGPRAGAFQGHTEVLSLQLDWEPGDAPSPLPVTLQVPPRWGAAGWIFVALAALALALGGWGLWQLRPAPVTGTLLYALTGRDGAVGRLDLAPTGRRAQALRADRKGRLGLGGSGVAVALLRPTRVGGLLVVVDPEGAEHRHLLVDGLSVTTPTHRLRYVSGRVDQGATGAQMTPEADLLGPEFDLASGRIEAATGRQEGPDDAGADRGQDLDGATEGPPRS